MLYIRNKSNSKFATGGRFCDVRLRLLDDLKTSKVSDVRKRSLIKEAFDMGPLKKLATWDP